MITTPNNPAKRIFTLFLATLLLLSLAACGKQPSKESESQTETETETETEAADIPVDVFSNMVDIDASDIYSDYALLCRLDSGEAVAGLNATERMYPASLTKLMTFIVAYENAADRSALIEITQTMKNLYPEGSRIGIDLGDLMTVEQMMYALLLESDTDAALGLTFHVAYNEEAFVALMNAKAIEMGLKNTHFTNVTGLHNDNHYSTAADMATVMAYVLNIPLGRTILTTDVYATFLKYYKNGVLTDYRMTFYNTTLRDRFSENDISTQTPNGLKILGGKTGYTEEAEHCLATVAVAENGEQYILITGHAVGDRKTSGAERSARDAVTLYDKYATK